MLTDTQLKALKPAAKLYKVGDPRGLYVAVTPTGWAAAGVYETGSDPVWLYALQLGLPAKRLVQALQCFAQAEDLAQMNDRPSGPYA